MASLWGDPVPTEMALSRELPMLIRLPNLVVIFQELHSEGVTGSCVSSIKLLFGDKSELPNIV